MPRLIVDDRGIEVPTGVKVIEAAERLGIVIPRFCYHEALGSVGACRMCAVKFMQGPFKGVQMSCMVDAQDGMVVSTTDPEVVEFRKFVIECLMLNHPHDCPVCDEGGQCLLQDETVSGGHGVRRYLGKKRTYRDQYLGTFIAHEMNRCIHCYRCSRFYQDFAGYRDLGPMQSANRVYFGRFSDGRLESPFSGNLVDICPTGVYTDKPARFKARRWDLQRTPSICIHCSLGCNTIGNARYREVVRVEARFNGSVNGYFLCDRGRFGFSYANRPDRPRRARIGEKFVPMDEAVRFVSERLKRITLDAGRDAVACLGSARSSIEVQSILKRLCRWQLWRDPSYFVDPANEAKVKRAVSRLRGSLAVSLREVEDADFVLVVGSDPVNEAPMLALSMRQAFRKGAHVVVADPRPVSLPFAFDHLPVRVRGMEGILRRLANEAAGYDEPAGVPGEWSPRKELDGETALLDRCVVEKLSELAERLARSKKPVIVCGTGIVGAGLPDLAADCAEMLLESKGHCGLYYVFHLANAFGAALFSSPGALTFPGIVSAIESGKVRALLIVESDPLYHYPDRERLDRALQKLEFLAVLDCLPSRIGDRAHVFLPVTTVFESASGFINQEGRLQYAERVHLCGLPILEAGGGTHPPRVYGLGIPGADPKDARELIAEISAALSHPRAIGADENPLAMLAEESLAFAHFADLPYPGDGVRVVFDRRGDGSCFPPKSGEGELAPDDLFDLLLVERTFGTEELSSYTDAFREIEGEPCLIMNGEDAAGSFSDGDRVRLHADRGPIDVRLRLTPNVARRTLVLPRYRWLDWQKFVGFTVKFPFDRIERL